MGLFSKKRKVTISEFCQDYYDTVFKSTFHGIDASKAFNDSMYDLVVEADKSFTAVDRSLFIKEMKAIRLELFALAWMQRFQQDEYTIPQSIFTRNYLEKDGELDIWDAMGRYNIALAKSAKMDEHAQYVTGKSGIELIARIDNARADLGERWINANVKDPSKFTEEEDKLLSCVCRVANRIGVDIMQNNEVGNRWLTTLIFYRLGEIKALNNEAMQKFPMLTFMMYTAAKEALQEIDLLISKNN